MQKRQTTYKNTEFGPIPEDWGIKDISMLIQKDSGIKIGPFGSQLKKELLVSSGYKVYGQENVYKNNLNLGTRFITTEHYKQLSACEIKSGDFLISMMGTIGKCMIVPHTFQEGIMDSHLIRLRLDKSLLDSNFLENYFKSEILIKQVKRLSVGGIMDGLSSKIVKKISIPLPPSLSEQKAIATALSDADALISSLEQLINKKRAIKQGAMQELLRPKDGWEVKKLGDYLDYMQPTEFLVTDTEYNDNNQTPVLTAGKTFILGYTNEEHGIFNNLPVIIFDDFTTAIKYVDFPFKAKSSAMKMLIPKHKDVNLRFIYELMLRIKYPLGDHKRHWIGEYRHLEIILPASPLEQNKIATILTDMDSEIIALEKRLNKYKQNKQGMMQQLLTGKIRLV